MNRWLVGWALGTVVVAIAASLLIALILLCRRIVGQAQDITEAIDGARGNTDVLYRLTDTNRAIGRITDGLRTARGGAAGS